MVVVSAALSLVLASCGSDGSGDEDDPGSGSSGTRVDLGTAPEPSAEDLKAIVERGFLGEQDLDELDPVVEDLFKRLSEPLSAEDQALYEKCVTSASCETGRGNITVGISLDLDNTSGRVARGEIVNAAIRFPAVAGIKYLNSRGDLATSLSNFRSLIAQQVDLILIQPNFASSMAPLLRQAKAANIAVASWNEEIPSMEPGEDYTSLVMPGLCEAWTAAAETAVQEISSPKTYALFTGPAGNTYAEVWQPCVKKVLDGAGWTQITSGNTDWTPQGETQAGSALLASGDEVGAIFYDYVVSSLARPFITAGKAPAAGVFHGTSDGEWMQLYKEAKDEGITWLDYTGRDGNWHSAVTLSNALHALADEDVNPSLTLPVELQPTDPVLDFYDASAPSNVPLGSLLTAEQITLATSG